VGTHTASPITAEAAVHHTVVLVCISGIAAAVHSVGIDVVVCTDHTMGIRLNHVLES